MAVSPADVKKLRGKTGAGMLDCKNALVEASGDFTEAEKILKKSGLAKADKKSGRATNEGSIFTKITADKAVILELTCETDFVSQNDKFKATGAHLLETVLEHGLTEVTDVLTDQVKEAVAVLNENMTVKRLTVLPIAENETVVDYIHGGGKIGVLIKLVCDSAETAAKDEVRAFGFDAALHAAAYNPLFLNRNAIDAKYMAYQEEIFTAQAIALGKPEKVAAGIVKGKMNKHIAQICFVDQKFVKDDTISVKEAADQTGKAAGGTVELADFIYFQVGEDK
ncbi:MAG: translation elongation factor Ts [Spirochaetaceae bacterium]|jgi:elongation factor Ts|nr:translation elongation factor Ts [Spirochaetaceae bacterium]